VAMLAVLVLFTLLVTSAAVRLSRPAGEAGAPLAWEAGPSETPFPATRFRPAQAEETPGAGKAETAAPYRPDWTDLQVRRRAAAALCLASDLPAALALLRADDPHRGDLLKVTPASNGMVLQALDEALGVEERSLALSAGPSGLPSSAAAGAPLEPTLPGGRAATLRRIGESLPEDLLYRFVVNVHCAVARRTGASDAHLKLLLEPCFSAGTSARKLYLNDRALRPVPYPLRTRVTGEVK